MAANCARRGLAGMLRFALAPIDESSIQVEWPMQTLSQKPILG
jgi:hypothetical protein